MCRRFYAKKRTYLEDAAEDARGWTRFLEDAEYVRAPSRRGESCWRAGIVSEFADTQAPSTALDVYRARVGRGQ